MYVGLNFQNKVNVELPVMLPTRDVVGLFTSFGKIADDQQCST